LPPSEEVWVGERSVAPCGCLGQTKSISNKNASFGGLVPKRSEAEPNKKCKKIPAFAGGLHPKRSVAEPK